jgi:hypothetical protein
MSTERIKFSESYNNIKKEETKNNHNLRKTETGLLAVTAKTNANQSLIKKSE